ncbi:MAG TPA: HU family DNA-binding protein [Amycolatopsis sp.]|uniref:HU family DNA-binding protein n=1 Tax=Amycolatopsis sp. TaxID=37632 RepID=UPI002B4847E8|nr:HU family DNA-binding protein [Amycolatopsis sp.]HKS44045.1 HU family DNA-binding protein [Amycolatopsis sp.]
MANKAQLIEALSERLGDKKVASEAVDGLVDIIIRTVNKGEKVNITGFGVFEKRARAARTARNPRTGETVKVKKTNVPAFRAGTTFKDVISGAKKLPKATAVKRASTASTRATGTTASRATTSRATATRPTATRSTTTRARTTAAATKTAAPKTPAKTTAAKKPAATKAAAPKATAAKTAATKTTAAKKTTAARRKK